MSTKKTFKYIRPGDKYLYSTGKEGSKPNCEYYTDGNEFDVYHRFTPQDLRCIENLKYGESVILSDELFKSDYIKITRVFE